MQKLFQGEIISPDMQLPRHLSQRLTGGANKLLAVGYYYSPECGYVLMLPNAYKQHRDILVNDWELLTTVHFMLERYVNDSCGKSKDADNKFQMPEFGKNRKSSFLDAIIRIRKFFLRNSGFFFTHIARTIQSQGAIDWNATVSKTQEIVVNDGHGVFYPNPVYSRVEIDVDHRLFVLFLSIVRYIKKYGCNIPLDMDLDFLSDKEIEGLIASKRGCRMLKSIRDMYYSDIAVEMWQLCYDFFDRNVDINDPGQEEYLFTLSFNLVFEKMIDTIIADPLISKKYSSAWARIDHVFEGPDPTIPDTTTLYVMDSKCYEEKESANASTFKYNLHRSSDSAHKQKAYIDKIYGDVAERGGMTENGIKLLDYNHESHRFIPNCFIVPSDDEMINLSDNDRDPDMGISGRMIDYYEYSHWSHKPLFNISTKYIFIFQIDLRGLMSAYATRDNFVSAALRDKFRKYMYYQIATFLQDRYVFRKRDESMMSNPKSGEQFLNYVAVLKK